MKILIWSVMSIRSPGLEVPVHPAGGVGDQEGLAAQQAEDPDGIADLLIGVALVVVDPALHHCHRLAGQGAKDQAPCVPGAVEVLKWGDGGVGDGDGVLHQVPQVAQAGAQDQGPPWAGSPPAWPGGRRRSGGIGQRYSS